MGEEEDLFVVINLDLWGRWKRPVYHIKDHQMNGDIINAVFAGSIHQPTAGRRGSNAND